GGGPPSFGARRGALGAERPLAGGPPRRRGRGADGRGRARTVDDRGHRRRHQALARIGGMKRSPAAARGITRLPLEPPASPAYIDRTQGIRSGVRPWPANPRASQPPVPPRAPANPNASASSTPS